MKYAERERIESLPPIPGVPTADERSLPGGRVWAALISTVAVAMALFHLLTVDYLLVDQASKYVLHVGFAVVLLLLCNGLRWRPRGEPRARYVAAVLALVIAGITVFAMINYYEYAAAAGLPQPLIVLVMSAVMLAVLFAVNLGVIGWTLPILAVLFLVYGAYADYFPGFLSQIGISWNRLLERLFLTSEGLYGPITAVSATFVFMFVLFGAMLQATGAGTYFTGLAMALFGRRRGGPAKVSVAGTAMFSMMSGSSIANSAAMGQFTIPLMRRAGYSPRFAASVEAVASMGGEVTPPIMAGSVFIMTALLGVSYGTIVVAAVLISVLFYVSVWFTVDIEARRQGLKPSTERAPRGHVWRTFISGWYFFLPVIAIFVLLFRHYPPERAALVGVIMAPLVVLPTRHRMSLKKLLGALRRGAITGATIGVMIITASVITGIINFTGMGLSLAGNLTELAGGSMLPLLLIALVSGLVLGMGLPAVTSYVLLAVMIAPALINVGADPIAAHLFMLYAAMLSQISPPVAPTVLITSGIAGSEFWPTTLQACRLAVSKFVLPFVIVYHPSLLLAGAPGNLAVALVHAVLVVAAFVLFVQGFGAPRGEWIQRVLMLVAGVLLVPANTVMAVIGFAVFALAIAAHLALRALRRRQPAEETTDDDPAREELPAETREH